RPCQGRGREFESRFPLQNLKSAAKHRPPNRSISNCDKAATERILGNLQKYVTKVSEGSQGSSGSKDED
ncbi:hypothetical protein, partial [Escherichia coli]|uniref:hypothetical protein n=10 Tax=Enterobacterales TaxID=91347 RepID=UPI001BC85248